MISRRKQKTRALQLVSRILFSCVCYIQCVKLFLTLMVDIQSSFFFPFLLLLPRELCFLGTGCFFSVMIDVKTAPPPVGLEKCPLHWTEQEALSFFILESATRCTRDDTCYFDEFFGVKNDKNLIPVFIFCLYNHPQQLQCPS